MDTNNASSNNNNSRQVILEGGLPWGFRIQGGSDTGVQLRIARVSIPTLDNPSLDFFSLCYSLWSIECFPSLFALTERRDFFTVGLGKSVMLIKG